MWLEPPSWPSLFAPVCLASCKAQPEHFCVTERPLPAAVQARSLTDSSLPHRLFEIEKRGLNSVAVAQSLSAWAGVPLAEIGYAGRKDRWALTRQWFSVPASAIAALALNDVADQFVRFAAPRFDADASLRVLNQAWQPRKLRIGELLGNDFELTLTLETQALPELAIAQALERFREHGIPNYFGAQRFGRDNLPQAVGWLQEHQASPQARRHRARARSRLRRERGWHLSTLRAFLFNEVVAARVKHSGGARLLTLDGDVLENGIPSGPLWGRGRSATRGLAAQLEASALAPHADLLAGLEYAGASQMRRPLLLHPQQTKFVSIDGRTARLSFALPKGAYATVVLAELFDLQDASTALIEVAA
ncbi:MAG: tRNA pseudouridine(13) synthase TruD [Pseudomonadales bacterium]